MASTITSLSLSELSNESQQPSNIDSLKTLALWDIAMRTTIEEKSHEAVLWDLKFNYAFTKKKVFPKYYEKKFRTDAISKILNDKIPEDLYFELDIYRTYMRIFLSADFKDHPLLSKNAMVYLIKNTVSNPTISSAISHSRLNHIFL